MIVIGEGNEKKPSAAKAWKTIDMPPKKKPSSRVTQDVSGDKNITVAGDADGVFISGKNNKVNQTITQIFNIFHSDGETLNQRNRRILLNHVENFWVKGVLEKSLYGEVLIELGIKEERDVVQTYPWGIKREATGETLPTGMTMLEIFEQIGLGRSLLILGAPGSGKTTMLLELSRQLIACARQDADEPIPIVFNLSSWTEKQTLAQWLAEQLNLIYYVPKKTAPDWINENKLLLLLDGLDEVRAESRAKCVETINFFRKEHGMTSLAVCSRSQDYDELRAQLAFDGAINLQSLTPEQVKIYLDRFGNQLQGINVAFQQDPALREMAESPLFLSIMTLAYQGVINIDLQISGNVELQRKYLFETYITRMFGRPERAKNERFTQQDILCWLSWLACKMKKFSQTSYLIENVQPRWLEQKKHLKSYITVVAWISGLIGGLGGGLIGALGGGLVGGLVGGLQGGLIFGSIVSIGGGIIGGISQGFSEDLGEDIKTVDTLALTQGNGMEDRLRNSIIISLVLGLCFGFFNILIFGILVGLLFLPRIKLESKQVEQVTMPEERLILSIKNFLLVTLIFGVIIGLILNLFFGILFGSLTVGLIVGIFGGLIGGLLIGLNYGGNTVFRHFSLRYVMSDNNLLPFHLIPFLDYCTDLIFLRRVGGGYIFVHRLLMEHFAEMYTEKYAQESQ